MTKDIKLFLILFFLGFPISILKAQGNFIDIYKYHDLDVELNKVVFPSSDYGWIVGNRGLIMNTIDGGITWSKNYIPSENNFIGVFFLNDQTGWVWSSSSLYKTNNSGIDWEFISDENFPKTVQFLNDSTGWKYLRNAIIRTTNGGVNWEVRKRVGHEILDLFFIDHENGYGVGVGGLITQSKDGGDKWGYLYDSGLDNLNSLHFINTELGWSVGDRGRIIKIKSFVDFDVQTSPSVSNLNSVYFSDSHNGVAVGEDGIIIQTRNGGSNWLKANTTGNSSLNSIIIDDHDYTWIVGDSSLITNKGIWDLFYLPDTTLAINQPFEIYASAKGIPHIKYKILEGPSKIQIDSTSGKIDWDCDIFGSHNVIINYSNGFTEKSNSFKITVIEPSINIPEELEVPGGTTLNFNISVTGISQEKYQLLEHPSGMTIDSLSGFVTWDNSISGIHFVKVKASNYFTSLIDSFSIIVYDQKLEIKQQKDTTLALGDFLSIKFEASGFPSPKIELVEAPSEMFIDSLNYLKWNSNSLGEHLIIWKIRNDYVEMADTFKILVYSALLEYSPILDTAIAFGDSLKLRININGFPIPNLELLKSPSEMIIDDQGHIYWQANVLGEHNVKWTAKNEFVEILDSFNVLTYSKIIEIDPILDNEIKFGDTVRVKLTASGYPIPIINLREYPRTMTLDSKTNQLLWIADSEGKHTVVWQAKNNFKSAADTFYISVTQNQVFDNKNKILQNFPNPFSCYTTFLFELKKPCKVRINIYDVLGNDLGMLDEKYYEVGEYEVIFDGSNLASGIYYYKFEAGQISTIKKMMLLK